MAFPRGKDCRRSGLPEARPSAASRSPWVQSPLVQHVTDLYTKTATYDVTPGGVGLPPIRAGRNYRFSAICLYSIGLASTSPIMRSASAAPRPRLGPRHLSSAQFRGLVQHPLDVGVSRRRIAQRGPRAFLLVYCHIQMDGRCLGGPATGPDRAGSRRRRSLSNFHLIGTPTRK